MFDMFNNTYIFGGDIEGNITKYNPETEKFIICDDNNIEKGEISLLESHLYFDINCWDDWKRKLFNAIIRNNGKVDVTICSTESGDDYFLTIYRHKTLLPVEEYSSQVILTNYVIMCNGEVIGDIYTRREKSYPGCACKEQEEFDKWIEEQIESVSEFNNSDVWSSFSSIVYFDRCFSEDEEKLINKWRSNIGS